jgi:8-amino-7-oxononanoate synthase
MLDGRELLSFASNDYLGLASHPSLIEAAVAAARTHGAGAGASRLLGGTLACHAELEATLAAFKGTPAAIAFASGHAAALGTIPALVGSQDAVILDRLAHACLIDAARLSGARLRVFKHNDLDHLEHLLQWARRYLAIERTAATRRARVLVVTESVFSMDGDQAPVAGIVALKQRYGAWLMVDEAHATGILGPRGAGAVAAAGLGDQVEIQMGTLGKALGAAGGFICGSRTLIDFLVNRARSFMFSTAPVPAQAAAAAAGLALARGTEGENRRATLRDRVRAAREVWPGTPASHPAAMPIHEAPGAAANPVPILPWIVGDPRRALQLSQALLEAGVYVPAIRYPAVARGQARLRLTLSAEHSLRDVRMLAAAVNQASKGLPPEPR